MTSRAIIKFDKIDFELVRSLIENSFEKINIRKEENLLFLELDDCLSFKSKLENLNKIEMIPLTILIVPNFDEIYTKYINTFNNAIKTIYEIFIQNYKEETIKKDIKTIYESMKKEEIDTLKAYISCNLNASLAASELYLHRNSFNYRMNNLEDRLNIDIKDINTILLYNLVIISY